MKKGMIFILFFTFLIGAQSPFISHKAIQKISNEYNFSIKNRFIYLNKLLNSLQKASVMKKLNEVNLFFNQAKYMTDIKLYHKIDYWATPYQFLTRDAGDCEDYVIAKYFALLYLHINPKKLYFVYTEDKKINKPHMVLAYFYKKNSSPLILDNSTNKILPANLKINLIPVYMFNPAILKKTSKSNNVFRKWDNLIKRIKKNRYINIY